MRKERGSRVKVRVIQRRRVPVVDVVVGEEGWRSSCWNGEG